MFYLQRTWPVAVESVTELVFFPCTLMGTVLHVMEPGVKVRENKGSCWPQTLQKADVVKQHDLERIQEPDRGWVLCTLMCPGLLFWFFVHVSSCVVVSWRREFVLILYIKSSWLLNINILFSSQTNTQWLIRAIIRGHRLTHVFVEALSLSLSRSFARCLSYRAKERTGIPVLRQCYCWVLFCHEQND